MTAKKYNPGRVEVDPLRPGSMRLVTTRQHMATFYGATDSNCAFAVEAINAAVDKLEKEGDAHE